MPDAYLYPPTIRGPLDQLDEYDRNPNIDECGDCGAFINTRELWRHRGSGCPAFHGAAGYARATLYTDRPLPPAGVTAQYRAEWLNARNADQET
ncbi:hypothetical protein SEA_TARDUS_72 [Gordonia phage Tardus]|uniref:Uncharacterized protein n=1 Tax=Gordonia phage Tardus TaxID=2939734 RepID=A0A9E7E4Y0_9CAUD|nr:hypothetical protein SEA_TARDUS_72 [Gordonia phage Tardus]